MKGSAPLLHIVMMLCIVLLLLAAGRMVAHGENPPSNPDPNAFTCTVRVAYEDHEGEQFASAPTVEEASDMAIENACALVCVESRGNPADDADGDDPDMDDEPAGDEPGNAEDGDDQDDDQDDDQVTTDIDGTAPAEEDPLGIEACVESCYDDAEILGTLCLDDDDETVYVDGSFDPGNKDH